MARILGWRLDVVGMLLLLIVVATAFSDLPPLLPLGEFHKEGFVYVFPLLALAYFGTRSPGAFRVPPTLTLLSLALLLVILLGVIANYHDIATARFKGRSGLERVVTQGMSITLGLGIALLVYNLTTDGKAQWIARGARIALLAMGFVGFFEFASWFSIPGLTQVHQALSVFVHEDAAYAMRLRTTGFEVSWTALTLTFLYPFALADRNMPKWKIAGYTLLVLVLVVLAQSRTALLVIVMQGGILAWAYLRRRLDLVVHAATIACVAALAVVAVGFGDSVIERVGNLVEYGNFSGNTAGVEESVSNVTRLAAIRAGIAMFQENPILGVGLGQYGFNYPGHLRFEDFRSWEVQQYIDGSHPNWPPTFSIHVRLLAETGIVGYLVWLGLLLTATIRSLRNADSESAVGRLHLAVAMTLAGWLMLGLSVDSFRFFGGWITLGVAFGLPAAQRRATDAPLAAAPGI